MKECIGNYFILNGELQTVKLFDNSLVYMGESVYEVVRLVGGIPLFFRDHMDRLSSSLSFQHKRPLTDPEALKRDLMLLAGSDKRKEINIKIVFNYNNEADNYLIYYVESHYPTPYQYRKGVRGILFFAERKDPQSKVINFSLKNSIHQELVNENAYEALLVNEDNLVTEGSKSNIFFMKNNMLVTAPDDMILKGITRRHILEICSENGIGVEFSCVNAEDLTEYESIIMTGTSPMVLPFNLIDDIFFNVSHPLIDKLRNIYIKRAEASIREFIES